MTTAHARHILVKDEDKCVELIQQINDGGSFVELAKEWSECPSGQNGGDLGTFHQGQMVPEFDVVVFNEPLGVYAQPVKTDFGFHVIEIVEREGAEPAPAAAAETETETEK
jgi:peptidyl-prolyl cis-trans isomerase C